MPTMSFQKNTLTATAIAFAMAIGGAAHAENDNAAAEPVTPSFTPAEKRANADAVYECAEPGLTTMVNNMFNGAGDAQAAADMTRIIGECVDQSVPNVTMPPAPVASDAIINGTADMQEVTDHMEALKEYESLADDYIDRSYLSPKLERKMIELTMQHMNR